MGVTPDEYELPMILADSCGQLARDLKVNVNIIFSAIKNNNTGKTRGMKFVRVDIDD